MKAYKRVKAAVRKEPSLVTLTKEATSSDAWGPHGSALAEICAAVSAPHEKPEPYAQVLDTLWMRLDDVPDNWRKVCDARQGKRARAHSKLARLFAPFPRNLMLTA